MKIYLKTWNQLFTHTSLLFPNRIELQLLAVAVLTDAGATYVGVNDGIKTGNIMENDVWEAITEMLRKRAIYPRHKLVQMWNTIYQHCEDVPEEEPIEVVKYNMQYDRLLFVHLTRQRLVIPPDFFLKRITFRDMREEVTELAHMIPDDVFSDTESPFGIAVAKTGVPYSLAQKVMMLESHVDFPQVDTDNLLTNVKALEKMDQFLTSLKEQYGKG